VFALFGDDIDILLEIWGRLSWHNDNGNLKKAIFWQEMHGILCTFQNALAA